MSYVALGVSLLLAFLVIITYNRLVLKKNKCLQSQGTITIYLKKRFDLIPNLIVVSSHYLDHEKEVFSKITELRCCVDDGVDITHASSEKLSRMWSELQINNENYPELKSSQQFLDLQKTLEKLEGQISAARRAHDANINSYNALIQVFPINIVARLGGFHEKEFLGFPGEDSTLVTNTSF